MSVDGLVFKTAAVGVVAAILAIAIKKDNPVFALLITLSASVLIFMMVLPRFSAVMDMLGKISDNIGAGREYVGTVIKIIGVAYAAEFGASVCADAGESGLASKIELAGKAIIMALSAPIAFTLLNQVLSLL